MGDAGHDWRRAHRLCFVLQPVLFSRKPRHFRRLARRHVVSWRHVGRHSGGADLWLAAAHLIISVGDMVAVTVPLIAVGTACRFINSELWGRVTDVPWGIVFPMADCCRVVRPTRGGLEGALLLIVLNVWFGNFAPLPPGFAERPVSRLWGVSRIGGTGS